MKPETERWIDKAQEHLGAAEKLFEGGYHSQAVFFCEQAVEVLLKAIWVEHSDTAVPPRTHDLSALAARHYLELSPGHLSFLRRLGEHYMPTRYPEMAGEYTEQEASAILQETKEFFSWLQQQPNN